MARHTLALTEQVALVTGPVVGSDARRLLLSPRRERMSFCWHAVLMTSSRPVQNSARVVVAVPRSRAIWQTKGTFRMRCNAPSSSSDALILDQRNSSIGFHNLLR
jgi:hypothetical protein